MKDDQISSYLDEILNCVWKSIPHSFLYLFIVHFLNKQFHYKILSHARMPRSNLPISYMVLYRYLMRRVSILEICFVDIFFINDVLIHNNSKNHYYITSKQNYRLEPMFITHNFYWHLYIWMSYDLILPFESKKNATWSKPRLHWILKMMVMRNDQHDQFLYHISYHDQMNILKQQNIHFSVLYSKYDNYR